MYIPHMHFIYPTQPRITQSRIIGAVRGAHSQLWGTIIPVCSLYMLRVNMTRDLAHLH